MTQWVTSRCLVSSSSSTISLTSSTCSPFCRLLFLNFRCWWIPNIWVLVILIRIILSKAAWLLNKYLMINYRLIKRMRILRINIILSLILIHKSSIILLLMMLKWHPIPKMFDHLFNPTCLFFIEIIAFSPKTKWTVTLWWCNNISLPPSSFNLCTFKSLLL